MLAVLLPGVAATALFAADYTITVSINGSTISAYKHKEKGGKGTPGANGHQRVVAGDTITWACDGSTCMNVVVKFKAYNPCSSFSPTTCTVNSNATLSLFPYSIAASNNSGAIAVDDPDVIVDNSGTFDPNRRENSKKK
jgi:hypothetical protein